MRWQASDATPLNVPVQHIASVSQQQVPTIHKHGTKTYLELAMELFRAKALEWRGMQGKSIDFTSMLKGGCWTQAVMKVPFHLCEGRATSPAALRLCERRGVNRIASFIVSDSMERRELLISPSH
eukprot:3107059-Amphidinium_carterae.1